MTTLFALVDAIVLVLLLTRVLRAFWKVLPKGVGSIILAIVVAAPLVCFAMVSFTVFVSFVTAFSSLLGQGIAVLFLVGMLAAIGITWKSESTGVS